MYHAENMIIDNGALHIEDISSQQILRATQGWQTVVTVQQPKSSVFVVVVIMSIDIIVIVVVVFAVALVLGNCRNSCKCSRRNHTNQLKLVEVRQRSSSTVSSFTNLLPTLTKQ